MCMRVFASLTWHSTVSSPGEFKITQNKVTPVLLLHPSRPLGIPGRVAPELQIWAALFYKKQEYFRLYYRVQSSFKRMQDSKREDMQCNFIKEQLLHHRFAWFITLVSPDSWYFNVEHQKPKPNKICPTKTQNNSCQSTKSSQKTVCNP